jgi:hypothetical protein
MEDWKDGRCPFSQPFLPFKEEDHPNSNDEHQSESRSSARPSPKCCIQTRKHMANPSKETKRQNPENAGENKLKKS